MIPRAFQTPRCRGFTAIELLAVVAALACLLAVALPLLARTRSEGSAVGCISQKRQLATAWLLYAQDHRDSLVNNFGIEDFPYQITNKLFRTWANNIMGWSSAGLEWQSATNRDWLAIGLLAPYIKNNLAVYRCPADSYVSPAMSKASITQRLRSVSMNSFLGRYSSSATDPTASGENRFSSGYRQFLKLNEVRAPQYTWTFIDEHPDSINDGVFISVPEMDSWVDLPASYHLGGAGFAFVDSHVEIHRWESRATIYPVKFIFPNLVPMTQANRGLADRDWYHHHTGYVIRRTGQLKFP
ncbi:MAG TPA: prepilin-type N-terminal cleavage/methylation domain-containing protein [Candidatus Limnocylindria bacterium]|jgi:prepilin-type N-terminal cleavage/methylation domain-containing protein/prepilin-type processing-associated H-X9-DG protein|nr:prepilin-type N-terminal cleavage/methylation domain-containing protein [Candidatus Limnocylindria bacterium]